MKATRGFSLIELMIVVAIIGILAAIAIPNYSEYVTKSRITSALSVLSDLRVKMEQYFQDNRSYPTACVTAGATATQLLVPGDNPNFDFTCTNLATNTFTITATGKSKMTGFVYTINQMNAKTTALDGSAGKASTGWAGNGKTCWVIGKTGGC